MAGVCEEAKIVFNVALAGTLDERGFERVSDAHYARTDLIGEAEITWRVLFGPPGSRGPKTFQDATGCFIPEVVRLCQMVSPKSYANQLSMAGTRYRTDHQFGICYEYSNEKQERYKPTSEFCDVEPCFDGSVWDREPFPAWQLNDADLKALGYRIDRYWRTYIENKVRNERKINRLQGRLSEGYALGDGGLHLGSLMECWLFGFREEVTRYAADMVRFADPSEQEVIKVLRERERKHAMLPFLWRVRWPSERDINFTKNGARRNGELAREFARVVGIDGKMP